MRTLLLSQNMLDTIDLEEGELCGVGTRWDDMMNQCIRLDPQNVSGEYHDVCVNTQTQSCKNLLDEVFQNPSDVCSCTIQNFMNTVPSSVDVTWMNLSSIPDKTLPLSSICCDIC